VQDLVKTLRIRPHVGVEQLDLESCDERRWFLDERSIGRADVVGHHR
jgi:hypothetical protein